MKLWEKGYQLDQLVEAFMTGDDPLLDHALIPYDCLGSIAHAKMLAKIGILTPAECQKLTEALATVMEEAQTGRFSIQPEEEDVHTAVENRLTSADELLGKKLHTARSRNDQVLLDMRLYSREQLLTLMDQLLQTATLLCHFAQQQHAVPIPGRTHFQRAMPSSMGLWAGAIAESLIDDMQLLKTAYQLCDQCPLGSAASYGVSLPIDRQYTSDLLGFSKVQNNVLYANNSRGKFEAVILAALVQVMHDLSKACSDIIVYCTPEFGYVCLPEKFCPGSSLMPQKRNPCPLELIRAKSAIMQGLLLQVLEITRSLPSGYHRDFQETKRPLMQGCDLALTCLKVFRQVFSGIEVQPETCLKAFSPELFATDRVLQLVQKGVPFRTAYKCVAQDLASTEMEDPVANILSKTHLGATGNLGIDISLTHIGEHQKWLEEQRSAWEAIKSSLLQGQPLQN
jgi:argininosuccinate lyase